MSESHYDIIVAGAGAGGLACALAAVANGQRVLLLEKSTRLGGTVTHSLIHTIGGLYDDTGEYMNAGLPVELAERLLQADPLTAKRKLGRVWVLNVEPSVYEQVVEDWIASQPDITLMREATVTFMETSENDVIRLNVLAANQYLELTADTVVDATGNAGLVQMLGIENVQPGDAQAGLIFQIQGVEPGALQFPKNVGLRRSLQMAVTEGDLSAIFINTWFDTGLRDDEVYAKLNFSAHDYRPEQAQIWQEELVAFLRQSTNFADARIIRRGELGVRDGGRIRGEYCLTLDDVKTAPPVEQSAGRCVWPVEYWQPDTGVTLDYLPPGHAYHIPLQALRVKDIANLWAVGKCLSAEKQAQASARVAGTCWAMGEAVGKAIAADKTIAKGEQAS